jgi:hypothetical protein
MIWATIRFYMTKKGDYYEECIGFNTNHFVKAAMMAETLCSGYTLGCGYKATVQDVRTIKSAQTGYILPDETAKLRDHLGSGIVI